MGIYKIRTSKYTWNRLQSSSHTSKRTSIIETTPVNKVDVDVLKRRVIHQKKKEKMQSRIILASAIVSLGVISYFAG